MTPTTRGVAAIGLSLLVLAVGVGAAAAAASPASDASQDKITICHKPGVEDRTLRVSRSAWNAHQAHGDHEGACDDPSATSGAGGSGPGGSGGSGEPPEPTPVASMRVHIQARGEVDGEASFLLIVSNEGEEAHGVRLTADLEGRGSWHIDPEEHPDGCTLERGELACDLGTVEADGVVRVRLLHDAGLEACAEASVDATVGADNDDDNADDNQDEASARVGACAVLPGHD